MSLLQQHRILIYTTCYNVLDGVTLTIRKLEQEILAAGHSVCILTTLSGDAANSHLDGEHPNRRVLFMDNAKPIPFVHDPNNPDLTYQVGFSLSRSIQRQLNDFEPTLIHITVPDCTALHLIDYARRKELPVMGTYHSNIPEYMDHYPGLGWLKPILAGFFRHQYNFMQALYVPTPFIQRHLTETYQLDRATRLDIWGRGVDIDRFHPDHRYASGGKFRAQLGLKPDDVVLCWVGRLVPEKRVDIFCDTVRRLHALGVPFHAIVVGAGIGEEEIKTLPNTTFCGWMNADQLAVAYASSDVFLFPSSVETFGNVTLEAMASGLPVVVEAGCSGHLVEEDINGYACPEGDFDAFFEATAELVQNESRRLHYSYNSRAKAEQLEKRAVVRQMLQHYSDLTDEFYMEYGGRHANRDKAYTFEGGNCPRPVLLVMVEWLFIVLFQVLWNMSQMFATAQDAILRRGDVGSAMPPPIAATTVPLQPQESPKSRPPSSPCDDRMMDPLLSSSGEEVPELDQVESEDKPKQEETQESSSGRRCQLDIPLLMALSLVHSMYFICRMESYLRNGITSNPLRFRKRKNSFDVASEAGEAIDVGVATCNRRKTSSVDGDPATISGSRHGGGEYRARRGVVGSMSSPNMMDVEAASQQTSGVLPPLLQEV